MLQQFFYIQYQVQGMRKKTRTRVQLKDIKIRFLKNLFLRFKSRYLCCSLQNKIIKKLCLQNNKISCGRSLHKLQYFFIIQFSQGKTDKVTQMALRLRFLQYRKSHSFMSYLKILVNFIGNN